HESSPRNLGVRGHDLGERGRVRHAQKLRTGRPLRRVVRLVAADTSYLVHVPRPCKSDGRENPKKPVFRAGMKSTTGPAGLRPGVAKKLKAGPTRVERNRPLFGTVVWWCGAH